MKRFFYFLPALMTALSVAGCPAPGGSSQGGSSFFSAFSGGGTAPADGGSSPSGGTDGGDLPPGPPEPGDPTVGRDTPVTVVGSPMASPLKPKTCSPTEHVCFRDVMVSGGSLDPESGWVLSVVSGRAVLFFETEQIEEDLTKYAVYFYDENFPDLGDVGRTSAPELSFTATLTAPPDRGIRMELEYCGKKAVWSFRSPAPGSSVSVEKLCSPPSEAPPPPSKAGQFHNIYPGSHLPLRQSK